MDKNPKHCKYLSFSLLINIEFNVYVIQQLSKPFNQFPSPLKDPPLVRSATCEGINLENINYVHCNFQCDLRPKAQHCLFTTFDTWKIENFVKRNFT